MKNHWRSYKVLRMYFRTKEIHFSLPPLRSNSLGDLECQQDNPYDSDIDSDTLLVPGQSHNHRSNSFSKFVIFFNRFYLSYYACYYFKYYPIILLKLIAQFERNTSHLKQSKPISIQIIRPIDFLPDINFKSI